MTEIINVCDYCKHAIGLLEWMIGTTQPIDEGYYIKNKWYCSKECANAANVVFAEDMWYNIYSDEFWRND